MADDIDIEKILSDIKTEYESSSEKFVNWPTDPLHALAVVGEEFGELTKAVLQTAYEPYEATEENVYEEALQTAAMALRFLISIEQYVFDPSHQHFQQEI